MEKPRLELILTGPEVYFLSDKLRGAAITPGGKPDERDYYTPLVRALLLVLASAYTEVVSVTGPNLEAVVPVMIDEEMAWLIREVTSNDDVDSQGHQLGLSLLLEVYAVLLKFHTEDMVDLQRIEEICNASTRDFTGQSTNESTSRDSSAQSSSGTQT